MYACSAPAPAPRSLGPCGGRRVARAAVIALLVSVICVDAPAAAQGPRGGRPLGDYASLREACEAASEVGRRELYQVSVATGDWRFGTYDEGREALLVDARPSLRVLSGVAAFLPSGLEEIEFPVDVAAASALRERAAASTLRVGFFLGFDGAGAQACLMRGAASQNLLRGDLAYVELVDAEGALVVRAEYDRLRAWLDDPGRVVVAGEGPRADIGDPSSRDASVHPEGAWVARARAQLAGLVERCYVPALSRGASSRASVIVRLTLNGETGAVRDAEVELSTLGDTVGARCVASELRAGFAAPALHVRAPRVHLRVVVTLLNE